MRSSNSYKKSTLGNSFSLKPYLDIIKSQKILESTEQELKEAIAGDKAAYVQKSRQILIEKVESKTLQ